MILDTQKWININETIYKANSIICPNKMRESFLDNLSFLISYDKGSFCLAGDISSKGFPVGKNISPEDWNIMVENDEHDHIAWTFARSKSSVTLESAYWSEEEKYKLKYYNNVYRPLNIHYALFTTLIYDNIYLGCISLYKSKENGDFNDQDIFIMDMLKEHISLNLYLRKNNSSFFIPPSLQNDKFFYENKLSKREIEIVQLILQNIPTKEISEQLFITTNTIKNHLHNIYAKTETKTKADLLNKIHSYNK